MTPPQLLVNLHLEAQKVIAAGAVGSQMLKADFPVSLLTNPTTNKIVGCFSQTSATQLCTEIGGTYNPAATPRCTLPSRNLAGGGCLAGQVMVGMNPDGTPNCKTASGTCLAGQIMNGIKDDGSPNCIAAPSGGGVAGGTCTGGKVMTGIDTIGKPVCSTPSGVGSVCDMGWSKGVIFTIDGGS